MNKPVFFPPVISIGAIVGATMLMAASAYGQTYSVNMTLQVNNLPAGTSCTQSMNGSTIVLDCGSGTTPPTTSTPTGCMATVNGGSTATLASTGGAVNLSVANCSPATGLTYSWLKNGQATANTATNWTDTLAANTGTAATTATYQVRVCNGATACATFPQSALTATVAGVQGNGTWNGTCSGFSNTRVVAVNANSIERQVVNFGPNDALVVELTTGSHSTAETIGYPSSVGVADYASQPSGRVARLSEKPCDFTRQTAMGANADDVNTVSMFYVVGSGNTYGGYYPLLKTNTKYYLNFKNTPGTTCFSDGNCNVFVEPTNYIN